MEYNKKKCPYCDSEFENIEGRLFSNHVRWCSKNPNGRRTENFKKLAQARLDEKFGEKRSFDVICDKCRKTFQVIERENRFPERERYFCSRTCANSHVITKETREKTAKALRGRNRTEREERVCLGCNCKFVVLKTENHKFCSKKCYITYQQKDMTEKLKYRKSCQFAFNIYKHPDKFDLKLIEKYGWYKAKNRGDNLEGVSRDHRVSIDYGWRNNVSPEIIRHPANCKLMRQRKNSVKHIHCSIKLEQLLEEIKKWDGPLV
jgi:hypothetical protein